MVEWVVGFHSESQVVSQIELEFESQAWVTVIWTGTENQSLGHRHRGSRSGLEQESELQTRMLVFLHRRESLLRRYRRRFPVESRWRGPGRP